MLDTVNPNQVEQEQHFYNFNDADKAILGIYGKLMGLVERVVVLGELRADLMDYTENATFDQIDISRHTAAAGNKYCDVAPFYEVILNCNDALANFDRMKAERRLSEEEYGYRYADVVTVRSWVYLQLAIHFGSIPYITDPLATVDAVSDRAKFTPISFDDILDRLVVDMESIPKEVRGLSTLSPLYNTVVDGNDMTYVLLNKNFVRGDIHLWKGNYLKAAECYYDVIADAEVNIGGDNMCYKVDGWVWDGANEPRFQVTYARYRGIDLAAYRNKWKEIFSRAQTNSEMRREAINVLQYDPRFLPKYPLIELFASTGQGKYQLKPTKWAMDSLWEAQVQRDNYFQFDGRGRDASFDNTTDPSKPIILKYLYDYYAQSADANRTISLLYDQPDFYKLQGRWFIYRAGLLHLRYAEAVNRAGYPDLAYALINDGVQSNYDWPMNNGNRRENKEGVQYTGFPPANDSAASERYDYPFFLDARFNADPYYRSPWRDGYGIRRRACLLNIPKPSFWIPERPVKDVDIPAATDHPAVRWMEDCILREAALECGFEGHRWGDMLRIALRKSREGGGDPLQLLNQSLQKAKPDVTVSSLYLPMGRKE